MKLTAFTDGASRGNPGDAAIGIVVKDETGTTVLSHHQYLGQTTNNIAEYTALLECIRLVKESPVLHCTELSVHTDSELMARQMTGVYRVKDPGIKVLYDKVRTSLASAGFLFTISHIPRSKNAEADKLANAAIDARTV